MPIHKKSGFTLIELLITISIIAILSAIGLVAYSSVLKQGRDSKRQSDLRSIQSALEQYYFDQGYYPAAVTAGNSISAGTRTYMTTVPTGAPAYVYRATPVTPVAPATCDNDVNGKCTSYCLFVQLDVVPSPISSPPSNCGVYPVNYNFFVSPP